MTIPVRVAKVSKDIANEFKTCCALCDAQGKLGQMGRKEFCKNCNTEKPEIKRYFQLNKNEHRVITEQEEENLADFERELVVLGTINKSDIQTSLVKGSHWVLPETDPKKGGDDFLTKAYAVLQKTLEKGNEALVVKYTPSSRSKQRVGILTSFQKFMTVLEYPFKENFDEPTDASFNISVKVTEEHIKSCKSIFSQLGQVDPFSIEDSYSQRLIDIVTKPRPTEVQELKAKIIKAKKEEDEDPFARLIEVETPKPKGGKK